jgi:hypothetical protein
MNTTAPPLYHEKQRFTQWWMWGIILLPLGIALKACFNQFIQGVPFGNNPMSNDGLLLFLLFGWCFAYFFYVNELRTNISQEAIHVQFYPYTSRSVRWDEVAHCEVMPYDFVGGWGVRLFTKYGTVYNVCGGKGLFVQLKNKQKFLIGTQKPEELQRIVEQLQQSRLNVITE